MACEAYVSEKGSVLDLVLYIIIYLPFFFSPDTWSPKVTVFVILDIWLQE